MGRGNQRKAKGYERTNEEMIQLMNEKQELQQDAEDRWGSFCGKIYPSKYLGATSLKASQRPTGNHVLLRPRFAFQMLSKSSTGIVSVCFALHSSSKGSGSTLSF